MISTLWLFSPLKKWLLRSVLTTSLSTVNWTFLQNSLCSSGLIDNLNRHQAEMEEKLHIVQAQKKLNAATVTWLRYDQLERQEQVSLRQFLLCNLSGNAW